MNVCPVQSFEWQHSCPWKRSIVRTQSTLLCWICFATKHLDCITHKKCCKWRRGRNRAFETIKKGIEKSHWKSRRQQQKNYYIGKKKEIKKTTKTDVEGKKMHEERKHSTTTVIRMKKEKYSKPKEFRTVADGRFIFTIALLLLFSLLSSSCFLFLAFNQRKNEEFFFISFARFVRIVFIFCLCLAIVCKLD